MSRIVGPAPEGIQAVILTLRIIEYVAEGRRPVGVTALAQALDTTKSRIFRHLQTLVLHGYLVQDPETERYRIGPRMVGLGRRVSDDLDLVEVAMPILRDLRDALGHHTVVSELEESGLRVLATVPGRSSVEIMVRRGSLLPFHAAAQGKAALAFAPDDLLRRVLRSRLEMLTPHTIVGAAALEQELIRIRACGWATAYNESLVGLNALAAPVFDAAGCVVAAVGIVDSIQFIAAIPSNDQLREIVKAAQRISALLGYRRPDPPTADAETRPLG